MEVKKINNWSDIGNTFKNARKSKKLYQKDVAKLIDVSTACYCMYENGKRAIPFKKLKKICRVLGVDVNTL
jgi:transcriptional regulator with XRE-family HTH domain